MNRNSNQYSHSFDINQIALKNFYQDCEHIGNIQNLREKKRYEVLRNLLTYHQNNQCVRADQKYVKMWLEVAKLVQDKEQVYVYMYMNDIGQGNTHFYKAWIQMYLQRRQFILAYQLQKQTKQFFSEDFYNKSIQSLVIFIKDMIAQKYMRNTPKFENAYHDQEGIDEEDFQILNGLTLEKRIYEVESQISGIWGNQKKDGQSFFSRARTGYGMSIETSNKRRYSDLINMKNVSDDDKNGVFFYVEQKYRDHFVPEVEQLVYEISYYEKKYYNINPSGSKKFKDNSKFKFWLKQSKVKLAEDDKEDFQNFLRISNAVKQDKKHSQFAEQSYHNSPKPTKKRSSFFECKRNQKKQFLFQQTKNKISQDFNQVSTCENLNHLDMDQVITTFDFQSYFEESNSSLNCYQRLGRPNDKLIKDNIINELPRHNKNSFTPNQVNQIYSQN